MKGLNLFNPHNLLFACALFASSAAVAQPTLSTLPAASVSHNYAWIGGQINPNGGTYYTAFAYGETTSYTDTIGAFPSPVSGNTVQTVMNTPNPAPATTYHYRLLAQSTTGGPIYAGQDVTFTTDSQTRPNLLSYRVVHLPGYSFANFYLNFNPNHGETTITFEWGRTPSYGSTGYVSRNYIDGFGNEGTSTELAVLQPNEVIYYRWKAGNRFGQRTSPDMILNVGSLGVAGFEQEGFTMYPQPAADHLHITAPAAKSGLNVQIAAMDGRLITVPFTAAAGSYDIDISKLPAGTYHIVLYGNGSTYARQFIRQ